MKLDQLCQTFEDLQLPAFGSQAHPERDAILRARAAVGIAVVDDEFLADCLSWELRLLEDNRPRRGLVPFFTLPGSGVRFAFGYWPPGATPGPHEHTAWTITAVCRNELEVLTYDRAESYQRRELVPKNHFSAPAGRVGFIYEPCIHEPKNTSRDWSLSLHISSPRDGEQLCDYEEPLAALAKPGSSLVEYDHPYMSVIAARQRQRTVHQLACIIAAMDVSRTSELLAHCYRLASSATRNWIDQMAPGSVEKTTGAPWVLARTHTGLALRPRVRGDMWALEVETPGGPIDEMIISDEARAAIDFVSREPVFDVRALPGHLSAEEQSAIAQALEESGLFVRVFHD
jgi:hypothetical protein